MSPAAGAWAVLGGLRTLGADFAWLQMQGAWLEEDPRATVAWLNVAVELNPQSLYFLANGARILAFDVPAWRLAGKDVPAGVARRWRGECAAQALALLDAGRSEHACNPQWWIERGNLAQVGALDLETAAECYRQAARLPGAPYFAARLHAGLLRRLGRPAEAYRWLCAVHPKLPADEPEARAAAVLVDIRRLEEELAVPEARRYRVTEG